MPALTDVIPDPGHAERAASRFRGRNPRGDPLPDFPCREDLGCRDRAPRDRRGQARHGRHDARAYDRSAYRAKNHRTGARTTSGPASAPTIASTGSTRAARPIASIIAATGRELTMPHDIAKAATEAQNRHRRRGTRGTRSGACRRRARPRGRRVRGGERTRRPDPAHRAQPAPPRDDGHHRLADGAMRGARRRLPVQRLGGSGRRCSRRIPMSSSSRPAASRTPKCSNPATSSSFRAWDIIVGRREPRRECAAVRRCRRSRRAAGGRVHRRQRARSWRS